MNDLIKTTLYTGIGTIVLAKAKFKEFVEELIQNNELTQEEGQRVILALINNIEDTKNSIETKILSKIDQLLLKLKLPLRSELEIKLDEIISDFKSNGSIHVFKKKLENKPTTRS